MCRCITKKCNAYQKKNRAHTLYVMHNKNIGCITKQGSHMALCRALFGSSWWFMSWLVVISSDSCHGSWWFNVMVRGGLMSWFVVV